MNLCVFGAGAVGGYLAARLGEASAHDVSIVARGAHREAIAKDGLRLISEEGDRRVRFAAAVEDTRALPRQDVVFVTLKAHSLPAVAQDVRRLLKPDGHAVFITNGVPWWWSYGLAKSGGPSKVDPEGQLWTGLGVERVLGCVVYSVNEVTAPGTVLHTANNRWILAEPTNALTPRLQATADLMLEAGLGAEISTDLRLEIFRKLLRNAPFNCLCALTRLSPGEFPQVSGLTELAQAVIDEVIRVAAAKGWILPPADARDVIALDASNVQKGQGVRSSMLNDVLAGRPVEVEAILGQLQQFAREERAPIPAIDLVYSLLAGLDLSIRRATDPAQPLPASPGAEIPAVPS
jgi:2-dehydropantoate 2-reductase